LKKEKTKNKKQKKNFGGFCATTWFFLPLTQFLFHNITEANKLKQEKKKNNTKIKTNKTKSKMNRSFRL